MRAVAALVLLFAVMALAVQAANPDMDFVDEAAFVERAAPNPLGIPANMSSPASHLKKPIIFDNTTKTAADKDAPLLGKLPTNSTLKKPAISKNIFGTAVTFVKGKTPQGCPCKKQAPKKFRYDAEFKPEPVKISKKCCCKKKKAKKSILPPVVAELKPKKVKAKKPVCKKPKKAQKPKIAPEYYPVKPKKVKKVPCGKKAKKNVTVTPEFYPAPKLTKLDRARNQVKIVPKNSTSTA